MALLARTLAPHGIAFVSYNALPGARLRTMLREIALLHAGAADGRARAGRPLARALRLPRAVGGGPAGRLRAGAADRVAPPARALHRRPRPRRPRRALRPGVAARRGRPRRPPRPALPRRRGARPSSTPTGGRRAWTSSSTRSPAATGSSGSSTPTCSPAASSARRCCAARTRRWTTRSTRPGSPGSGSARRRRPSRARTAPPARARSRSCSRGGRRRCSCPELRALLGTDDVDGALPGALAGRARREPRAAGRAAADRARGGRAARGEPARALAGGARAGADQPPPRPRPPRRPVRPRCSSASATAAATGRRCSTASWPPSGARWRSPSGGAPVTDGELLRPQIAAGLEHNLALLARLGLLAG